jgi:ribosomal protein L11 methyltransferase
MRAFVVVVPEHDVEAASDLLWQLGVRAIEERHKVSSPEVELWTAVGDEPEAIERAVAALGDRWTHRVVEVSTEAADTWRDFAAAMHVSNDLVVVPAWLDHVATPVGATVVRIEPGGAFGLGDHPTTLLSLQATYRLLHGDTDVLDVGCGTGVIAVAAALLQSRKVRAIDVASAAAEATLDNAHRNGVSERVVVDTATLDQIDGTYDLVVANILAPVLVSLARDLQRVTRPAGRLVISGILADSHQHVLDALAPMEVVRTDVLDGWACVELRSG